MNRRTFLINATLASILPLLNSCSANKPLQIGIIQWIGYQSLYLAEALHWLPENITLNEGSNTSESMNKLLSGQLDGACLNLDEALFVQAQGLDITVVTIFDISVGANVVLARPDIDDSKQIKGKRVAVEQTKGGMILLRKLLETAGLTQSDIDIINIPTDQQVQAWQDNKMDVVVSYEPTASQVMKLGANRLFDSKDIPNTIFDVLVIRRDRLRSHYSELKALVGAHFAGIDHINTLRQDAIFRIAARQGIMPQEVHHALTGIALPSLVFNHRYLNKQDGELLPVIDRVIDIMVAAGLIEHISITRDFISNDYIPAIRD
ncbi:MAG: ABC transporter substrate-binding protein [Gammaproteobacteria bacterium]|nr:ABC transporter substrate-binding protein [Gammaproteobacteria bacterium]